MKVHITGWKVRSACLLLVAMPTLAGEGAEPKAGRNEKERPGVPSAAAVPVGQPMGPPAWAKAQRDYFAALNAWHEAFLDRFINKETGVACWIEKERNRGTLDDCGEYVATWDKFCLLGANDRVRAGLIKMWKDLYAQAHKIPGGWQDGYYRAGRGYDGEHAAELVQLLFGVVEMAPEDPELRRQVIRIADLYIGPCYNPKTRLFRNTWLDVGGGRDTPPGAPRDTLTHLPYMNAAWQAYCLTGDEKYRAWCLEYGASWNDLARENGGLFPHMVESATRTIPADWWAGPFGYDYGITVIMRGLHSMVGILMFLDRGDQKHLSGYRSLVARLTKEGREGRPASSFDGKAWGDKGLSHVGGILVVRPYEYGWSAEDRRFLEQAVAAGGATGLDVAKALYVEGLTPDRAADIFQTAARRATSAMATLKSRPMPEKGDDVGDHYSAPARAELAYIDGSIWGTSNNARCGGVSSAPLRYFHRDGRQGLPTGVSAFVHKIEKDRVVAYLYNDNAQPEQVMVTGGHYGTHRIDRVASAAGSVEVGAPRALLALPPNGGGEVTLLLTRYAFRPSLSPQSAPRTGEGASK